MSNTESVPQAWQDGQYLRQGALMTNGESVWTYHLRLGTTLPDGRKVAIRCDPGGVTSRRHLRAVEAAADLVVSIPEHRHPACSGVWCAHREQAETMAEAGFVVMREPSPQSIGGQR